MNINKVRPFVIAYRRWIAAGLITISISVVVSVGSSPAKFQVVTAAHHIEAGALIQASDIALVETNFVWKHAFIDTNLIVGKHAARSLEMHEPISESDVSHRKIFDSVYPKAVAITLPTNASAANLKTGDRIDVYASTQNGQAQREALNALVLNQHTQKNLMTQGSTISLAVRPEQVKQIAAFDDTARFTFVTLSTNSFL